MASKLTKDQKREKKKREERKLQLRRAHEENRHNKKFSGLLMTLTNALEGVAQQQDLDEAVLRVGGGQSVAVSERESRFQSPEWAEIKQRTSRMVALLREDAESDCAGLGLQGRVFLNGDGGTRFSSSPFPLFAMLSSYWLPDEVVHKLAKELDPEPSQGAYFFGVEVRDLAVHFAIASTTDAKDEPEAFYVTPKGWHRLDTRIWRNDLWPGLGHLLIAHRIARGTSFTEMAIASLMEAAQRANDDEEAEKSEPILDESTRGSIRSLGADLLFETEVLLSAAEAARARKHQDALTYEWNEGFEARQGEIDALEERYRALEQENQTLRRVFLQSKQNPVAAEHLEPAARTIPAKSLQERMGALLGL